MTTAPAAVVSAPSNSEVVVTLKGGTGYDAPWIVVHAANAQDAIDQIHTATMATLMERAQAAAVHFIKQGGGSVAPANNGGGQQQSTSNAPRGAKDAPNGETRQCKHGAMQFNSGAKGGVAWKGFFCPLPKNAPDKCEPSWIRD